MFVSMSQPCPLSVVAYTLSHFVARVVAYTLSHFVAAIALILPGGVTAETNCEQWQSFNKSSLLILFKVFT